MIDHAQYTPGPASGAQVRKDGEKWTQKASIMTHMVAKCSKRSTFSIGFVRMKTGLHFEAFYASWISL